MYTGYFHVKGYAMTEQDAVKVLYKYSQEHLYYLWQKLSRGPEGIETYVEPQIKELTEALDITKVKLC